MVILIKLVHFQYFVGKTSFCKGSFQLEWIFLRNPAFRLSFCGMANELSQVKSEDFGNYYLFFNIINGEVQVYSGIQVSPPLFFFFPDNLTIRPQDEQSFIS